MADITVLSVLIAGVQRNVDISANTVVVGGLKVGVTELTETILGRLISLQDGSDVDATYHTHDGRYFTESELGAATGTSGSMLIGDENTYSNFTPSDATVKGALQGIDSALASAGSAPLDGTFRIENTADPTKEIAFDASAIATGTTRTLKMANANVDLANLTNSNISGSAAIAYSKLSLSGSIVNADISSSAAIALSKLAALSSHNRVLVSDNSGVISESSVTTTTLGYLDATSSIQTQLNATEKTANKGQANGYASLDGSGKVPVAQLPNSIMEFQGNWNATTNSPTLADGTGNTGDVYRVNVAGTQDLGSGSQTFVVGDWVMYAAGGIWQKSHGGADAVVSVNGAAGVVVLTSSDIAEGSNLYFTDERAQDAIGSALTDTGTIAWTYDDGANTISSAIVDDSITDSMISSSAAIAYSKLNLSGSIVNADVASGAAIAYSKLSLAASIVNADIASGAAIAYSKLALSNSIVAGDLTSSAVTTAKINNAAVDKDKLATNAFDQDTIVGGAGTSASVDHAPSVKNTFVAGESFAANTGFLVRMGINSLSETTNRVYKADQDASSTDKFWVIGIAWSTGAVSAGQSIQVLSLGSYTLQSNDTGFSTGDIGKPVWLTASGAWSVTAPSSPNNAAFKAGMIRSTTSLWINGQMMGVA